MLQFWGVFLRVSAITYLGLGWGGGEFPDVVHSNVGTDTLTVQVSSALVRALRCVRVIFFFSPLSLHPLIPPKPYSHPTLTVSKSSAVSVNCKLNVSVLESVKRVTL